jgi:histidine ammonia-lyase
MRERPVIVVGEATISPTDIVALARGQAQVALDETPSYRARLEASRQVLAQATARGEAVYGVTTGFGRSCDVPVTGDLISRMPENLVRFHGCGVGPMFSDQESAAIVAVRLVSLARGYSGVRTQLLEGLCALINHRVLPRIPSLGSVGASGDLTPLSYVAAVLMGEREVSHAGTIMPAAAALEAVGLSRMRFEPKETLAIMNGTSAMTGVACLALEAVQRLCRFACALTAMTVESVRGNAAHFDERIFALKPHPGQTEAARWIREDLGYDPGVSRTAARVQDRYSLRCAPHVIGVALDTLTFARNMVEIEVNGVNDNPIADPESGRVLMGGNFYGGHVCQAMDALKTAVASVADLIDRQMILLCDATANGGLPLDLVAGGEAKTANFGFKAMQILSSALTAEALKLTMPAAVFSRSTEGHNQDKVSMGTIAARDCRTVVELCETVAAVHLLALCQAVDLRGGKGHHAPTMRLHEAIRREIPMIVEDRAMDADIALVLQRWRAGQLPLGAEASGESR